jgi:hypothetical protein
MEFLHRLLLSQTGISLAEWFVHDDSVRACKKLNLFQYQVQGFGLTQHWFESYDMGFNPSTQRIKISHAQQDANTPDWFEYFIQ